LCVIHYYPSIEIGYCLIEDPTSVQLLSEKKMVDISDYIWLAHIIFPRVWIPRLLCRLWIQLLQVGLPMHADHSIRNFQKTLAVHIWIFSVFINILKEVQTDIIGIIVDIIGIVKISSVHKNQPSPIAYTQTKKTNRWFYIVCNFNKYLWNRFCKICLSLNHQIS